MTTTEPDLGARFASEAKRAATLSHDDLLELYRRMVVIRQVETRVSELFRDGQIPGFVHLSIGQEASAVGACWPLTDADVITSTHRGHGHCLAKGLDPEEMFAELLGRETGTCRGRGGSMHIADPGIGIFGANGIVGAGLPIAVGAATASQLRDDQTVTVSFFGDGAVAQGAFHESVNLAAVWGLPVVFLCENNRYAEFSPAEAQHPVELVDRARGYGLPHVAVDGNDIVAVAQAMTEVVASVRAGSGPVILEAETYRWHGHYEGDPQVYRTKEEIKAEKEGDPLEVARRRLLAAAIAEADIDALRTVTVAEIDAALERAEAAPVPDPATVLDDVSAPSTPVVVPVAGSDAEAGEWKTYQAISSALTHALEDDPTVFLAGVDIGAGGNVFGLTRGLHARWPDRVRDTPISETAVMGVGVGAAMAGFRPVVELMYLDFIGVCFDQLLNQAAKLRYMTGGRATIPLVVRTQFGGGRSAGSQHSQSLEVLLAHVPGLTVVMPSNPADAYGLLRSAIDEPNPVVVIENRQQYSTRGPKVPRGHRVPLGKAAVVRPGRHVTVVSISRMVEECLAAAETLAAEGIDVEVIDLRTLVPLDRATVAESVRRTGRLVVAHEAVERFGFGGELAALAADEMFWHLDAPVRRVGGLASPVPYSPVLEKAWLPERERIAATIREVART